MSNERRCIGTAARYLRMADSTKSTEKKQSYLELRRLWLALAITCANFDHTQDPAAKEAIYSMIDQIDHQRRTIEEL
jgi:hypothetical protein